MNLQFQIYLACSTVLLNCWIGIYTQYTSVVKTYSGNVRGNIAEFKGIQIEEFLGIPYAEPPVGQLRFRKTRAHRPWDSVLNAFKFPPGCPQDPSDTYSHPNFGVDYFPGQSEDCLYLNIWVPSSPAEVKAVMFFIYGGSFIFGSNRLKDYDGKAMAAFGNVIVVTVNYRLGPLALFSSGTDEAPGNLCLYDCLEALKWVNANIFAFGGDPNRITLIGESAGAIIISLFSVSPITRNLYRRAIMQSGPDNLLFYGNEDSCLHISQLIAESHNCSTSTFTLQDHPKAVLECMRKVPALQIIKAKEGFGPSNNPNSSLSLHFDNELFPVDPQKLLSGGDLHQKELLIGCNKDEGSLNLLFTSLETFGPYGYKNTVVDRRQARSLFEQFSPVHIPKLRQLLDYYIDPAISEGQDVRLQLCTLFGDFQFMCPMVHFAQNFAKFANHVFFYFFTHRPSSSPWAPWMGVAHGDELPFVFGKPLTNQTMYDPEELALSRRIISAWTNFAKTGYPGENWKSYSKETPIMRILNTSQMIIDEKGPHLAACNILKQLRLLP